MKLCPDYLRFEVYQSKAFLIRALFDRIHIFLHINIALKAEFWIPKSNLGPKVASPCPYCHLVAILTIISCFLRALTYCQSLVLVVGDDNINACHCKTRLNMILLLAMLSHGYRHLNGMHNLLVSTCYTHKVFLQKISS